MTFNPGMRGPIFDHIAQSTELNNYPIEMIADSLGVEVYLAKEFGSLSDPEFWMATSDDVLIKFAVTGDMLGIYKKSDHNAPDTVVQMNLKHVFYLNRDALPINGVLDNSHNADEQLLESLVNYAYNKARQATEKGVEGIAKHFKVLTYDAIVSRFNLLKVIQSSTDIIPDQSPRTIFVKAGDGCPMECTYCVEGASSFVPYNERQFRAHIEEVYEGLSNILGDDGIKKMNEGFINISDIGWLDIYAKQGKTDLTSIQAAKLMRAYFPWIEKIGAFMGSKTVLSLSQEGYGRYSLAGDDNVRYSSEFLKRLRGDGEFINRAYFGIETGHDSGSLLIGKNVTYNQKKLTAELIQNADMRLKAIIQLGVLGEGFYPLDKPMSSEHFVPWYDATDLTAKLINEIAPYRLLESVHQPTKEMTQLTNQGRIVPYNNANQFEYERERLRNGLRVRSNDFKIDRKYEEALPNPSHKMVVSSNSV